MKPFTLIKTKTGNVVKLNAYPEWYVQGDFLRVNHSSGYYNLVDGTGNLKPHEYLISTATKIRQFMIDKRIR